MGTSLRRKGVWPFMLQYPDDWRRLIAWSFWRSPRKGRAMRRLAMRWARVDRMEIDCT